MTTYTTIPDGDIDQDSPVTQPLMTALRDNPIAIQEGDATAPNLLLGVAAKSAAGGIGTYVFAKSTTASDVGYGSTRAGSALTPTSALTAISTGSGTNFDSLNFTLNSGSALSGTWRCMGTYDYSTTLVWLGSPDYIVYGATLWLRIS